MAFWFGLLVESGLLVWPSGMAFCYDLLVEMDVSVKGGGFSARKDTPLQWTSLWYASYWNAFLFIYLCVFIVCHLSSLYWTEDGAQINVNLEITTLFLVKHDLKFRN